MLHRPKHLLLNNSYVDLSSIIHDISIPISYVAVLEKVTHAFMEYGSK